MASPGLVLTLKDSNSYALVCKEVRGLFLPHGLESALKYRKVTIWKQMFLGHYSFHEFMLPNYLGSLLIDHTVLCVMTPPLVAVLRASTGEALRFLIRSDLNGCTHLFQAPTEQHIVPCF